MSKFIIVRTKSSQAWNFDGQHDCAGTWVPVPTAKNELTQLKAAKGVQYLVHFKNGEFNTIYKVTGYHSERRDYTYRQLLELSGGDQDAIRRLGDMGFLKENACKNSVGIRFHLEVIDDEDEFNLIKEQVNSVDIKYVQGCKIFDL